tara:strand:- start:1 stop:339 length:339 start_codon:yes stop_codon:yes gene_type:complete
MLLLMKAAAAPIAAEAIPNNAYGSISMKILFPSIESEFKPIEIVNEAQSSTHMITKPMAQERAEHFAASIGFEMLLPFTNPIGIAVNIEINIADPDNIRAKRRRPGAPFIIP